MKPEKLIIKLQKCKDHAISKGGLCMSTEYKDCKTHLLWQCLEGHQWKAVWDNIKHGNRWCPYCAKQGKPDLTELQGFAISKNGLCLSKKYTNCITKILWQCSKSHQWKATWDSVKRGTWCPNCSLKIWDIKEIQNFAINKDGLLLSTEYINGKINLLWQCKNKHQWCANWENVKNGGWCPECSSFKTEKLWKELLEQKLNIKFEKKRFYYNEQRLEFDGYNKEHNIAFEYHGEQHYEFPNRWHKTIEEFLNAQKRDDLKEQFAAENNIKLIIIPYNYRFGNLDLESIEKEIIESFPWRVSERR